MGSTITLLASISWPYARRHFFRMALTLFSVVLGVALFVSIHTVNQAVVKAFRTTVDQLAGTAQLQISAGEIGVDEDVLDRVQSVPGVRVATPVIEAVVSTELKGQASLLILGVDMTADSNLRDYSLESAGDDLEPDPLVLLAQPSSIVIARSVADENALHIGSTFFSTTMQGKKAFTVTGIMNPSGMANAFGGRFGIMDIYAAQKMLGRGRRFDRVDVAVEKERSVEEVQKAIASLLGSGFQVDRPSARGAQFDSLIRVYSLTTSLSSAFALLVGMFIIYNTLQTSVVQRRFEIGILRSLGATRHQVRSLFWGEAAIIGLAGALVGSVAGVLIARTSAANISGLIRELYGVAENVSVVNANAAVLAAAVFGGILTSIFAAWIPAREASHIDPIKALHHESDLRSSEGINRFRTILAAVAVAMSCLCWLLSVWRPLLYVSNLLAVVAVLLIVRVYARAFAKTIRPALQRVWPIEGPLAIDGFLRASSRNSGVITALTLAFGLVIVTAGIGRASSGAIYDWASGAFDADLLVSPNPNLTTRTLQFPGDMLEQLQAVPSVSKVEAVRSARIMWNRTPVMLVAADDGTLRNWAAGALNKSSSTLDGVIVSDNFAVPHDLKQGDILALPSPDGVLHLPILAVIKSYFDQQGCIFLDRQTYVQHWHDSSVNVFRVFLKPNSSEQEATRLILDRFSGNRSIFVLSSSEIRGFISSVVEKWNNISYIPVAIAVFVAVLGIVNSLTVSIMDRKREIAVLRAIGAERTHIRFMLWSEALILVMSAFGLGLIIGGLQLYYDLQTSVRFISGNVLAYKYPFTLALVLLPLVAVAAWVSAIAPVEAAVRHSAVEGLEYE